MWLLAGSLPNEIQIILQNYGNMKFYRVFDMENREIGNAKIEDIEKNFKKLNDNVWIK